MSRARVVGVCLGLISALGACSWSQDLRSADKKHGDTAQGPHGDLDNPTAALTGPLPNGAAASCAERYSPRAVADRAFAFDGVVVEVGEPTSDRGDGGDLGLAGVTFAVREWFSGGAGSEVTVDMPPAVEGSSQLSEGGPSYETGSRLLVSGEPRWGGKAMSDPIAWGCGFTRYYDPATSESWARAVSGES